MRSRIVWRVPGLLTLGCLLAWSGWAQTPAPQTGQRTTKKDAKASDGAEKFQQNCSRCHNAPEGFSPRISGTIVRHMRVRASLSKEDAEAILHFLNP